MVLTRLGRHADALRDLIAEAAAHGEARDLELLKPDAGRPHLDANLMVDEWANTASSGHDSGMLVRSVRLVVS